MSDCDEQFSDCNEFLEYVYAFLDGELDTDTSGRLQRHLERCSHCLSVADMERHLRELLRSACITQAPRTLRTRIEQTILELSSTGADVSATYHHSQTVIVEE
ncbi:mycothiol system anti-sigma-R factor [Actinomycetaceae bacterium TAE3-ERU4]|nr:mycothiol system anti-sigma-R factor [Actinomycetaceae bacterium TAE3-ERU4]